ncbi:cytidylate kinase-like family protein [Vallitaleaceae bacterium 9-2]
MKNYVVTIARQYGSGGRLIGKKIAEKLQINFYDKELIRLAADETGYAESFVSKMEQKKSISFFTNLYMTQQELPATDQIFLAQSKTIRELANKNSCVIVGRCADYVLKDFPNCINIFIHAPIASRIERLEHEYNETAKNWEDYLHKQDKNRSSYYNYFTQEKWGKSQNYHVTLDSSIGIDESVDFLVHLIKTYQSKFK